MQLAYVFDTRNDLLEEFTCSGLVYLLVLNDVVEEFASRSELHDQVQLLGRLDYLVKLHQVRVLDDFQNMNLTRDTLYISHINNL